MFKQTRNIDVPKEADNSFSTNDLSKANDQKNSSGPSNQATIGPETDFPKVSVNTSAPTNDKFCALLPPVIIPSALGQEVKTGCLRNSLNESLAKELNTLLASEAYPITDTEGVENHQLPVENFTASNNKMCDVNIQSSFKKENSLDTKIDAPSFEEEPFKTLKTTSGVSQVSDDFQSTTGNKIPKKLDSMASLTNLTTLHEAIGVENITLRVGDQRKY